MVFSTTLIRHIVYFVTFGTHPVQCLINNDAYPRPSKKPKSEARNSKQTAMIKTASSKHREEGHIGLAIEWALPFCSFLPAEKKSKKAEPSQRMRLCI